MKLLKLLTMRQHTGGRLALLGGIVLWISSSIASPAQATIMDFTIDPGSTFFSQLSTFTLDDGGEVCLQHRLHSGTS